MKFKRYIIESKNRFVVTIRDIQQIASSSSVIDRDAIKTAKFLEDYWFEQSKKEVSHFLKMYSNAGTKALRILGDVPYVDKKSLLINLLSTTLLPKKESDLWPIPLYISSSPSDPHTVGILVHKSGKKELFEGNDEASPETYDLVDEILGNVKEIRVYGFHGVDLFEKVKRKQILPAGIYMSPSKKYASGYWNLQQDRILFSCVALSNAFRKESEYDWKTKKDTKCKNIKVH